MNEEIMTAKVSDGFVVFDNCKLERATNTAQNQFGYEEGMTWAEAYQIGIPIWVCEETGQPWISVPETLDGLTPEFLLETPTRRELQRLLAGFEIQPFEGK